MNDQGDFDPTPQPTQHEQDELFYKVVRFLVDGGELEEARLLLSCDVSYSNDYEERSFEEQYYYEGVGYTVSIKAQRQTYDQLKTLENKNSQSNHITGSIAINIDRAFSEFLRDYLSYDIKIGIDVDLAPGWRERLHELVDNEGVEASNQGASADKSDHFKLWQGLRFRSVTETRIAEALDKRAVLYMPNCLARMGKPSDRKNLEPDFLVCYEGKWGILEVDGEPFHTGLAARDHDRDRLFRQQGIKVVERYKSEECYKNSEQVVHNFLGILKKS